MADEGVINPDKGSAVTTSRLPTMLAGERQPDMELPVSLCHCNSHSHTSTPLWRPPPSRKRPVNSCAPLLRLFEGMLKYGSVPESGSQGNSASLFPGIGRAGAKNPSQSRPEVTSGRRATRKKSSTASFGISCTRPIRRILRRGAPPSWRSTATTCSRSRAGRPSLRLR